MVGLHYVDTKSQPFFIENNDDTHLSCIEVIDVTILSSFNTNMYFYGATVYCSCHKRYIQKR